MASTKKTLYERVQYIYSRVETDFLSLRQQKSATSTIDEVWNLLKESENSPRNITRYMDVEIRTTKNLMFFEKRNDKIVGIATEIFEPDIFEVWFFKTVLDNALISFESKAGNSEIDYAVAFTEIFETTIKNAARVDRWEEGRDKFLQNVRFFTSRQIPIEAVLPAFPCKSHNRDKVKQGNPDMGEELALRRIIQFVEDVNRVYPPGMKFYIVSDGHVFSDCINVDDDLVDRYTAQLIDLYEQIRPTNFDGICFMGLNDCFKSVYKHKIAPLLSHVNIDHHLDTMIDKDTDINRKILMLGCDDNNDLLREQVKTPGHPRLYLYRGFNKFMSEDLINTPAAKFLSGKKYKKLISMISFEMIRRNDAYSNLVELIFPFHLRFSIHAHHNAGPKYGIRLLNPKFCSTGTHNQDEEDRLLHIPTPWHNAVFKISDESKLIISPAKLALEYEKNPSYVGGWDHKQKCFVFERTESF